MSFKRSFSLSSFSFLAILFFSIFIVTRLSHYFLQKEKPTQEVIAQVATPSHPQKSSSFLHHLAQKGMSSLISKPLYSADKLSKEDLALFPHAQLLAYQEEVSPKDHTRHQVQLLKTKFKYPFLRLEKTLDPSGKKLLGRAEMVADHILVNLPQRKKGVVLKKELAQLGVLHQVTPDAPLYQLEMPIHTIDAVPQTLALMKGLGSQSSQPDFLIHPAEASSPNDPLYSEEQWWLWATHSWTLYPGMNFHSINAKVGWDVCSSAPSIIVAINDTGIRDTHEDLRGNMWNNPDKEDAGPHGWNFYANSGDTMDYAGHGTECAGIVGASGDNGVGICGVVRGKIQLMACKFEELQDPSNLYSAWGTVSDAVAGIDFSIDHGASLINCSYGVPSQSDAMRDALERAQAKNVIVLACAGNNQLNLDTNPQEFPACFSAPQYHLNNVVSVAALALNDQLSSYSNYGVKSTLLAGPGDWVCSTGARSDNDYVYSYGTSQATPFVTGALALLKSLYPQSTPEQLIHHLSKTTVKLPDLEGKVSSGGFLDLGNLLSRPMESDQKS